MSLKVNGGKREGAGRKLKYSEPTKVIRVPQSREMEIKKYLESTTKIKDISNAIQIIPTTHYQIPIALTQIAAGFPSPAQDHIDKTIDLNECLIKNKEATFIVEVESLSMRNAGIDVGDWLLVDKSQLAKHGDIIVAYIDNDFTIKRLMIDENGTWLKAENPDYQDIYFSEEQTLIVWGVVSRVIKNFK